MTEDFLNKDQEVEEEIDVSSGYLLQTAERSMKGDIVRGLVELITNSDDSYNSLADSGKFASGKIKVSILRKRKNKSTVIKVYDQAEGMTLEEMKDKLKRVSRNITSKFIETSGKRTRGLMGRGSKECVVFGKLIYKSIKNGFYSEIHIYKKSNQVFFKPIIERKVNIADYLDLDVPEEKNGTLVILEVNSNIKIPSHNVVAENLPKYYSLRSISSSSNKEISIIDEGINKERKDIIHYKPLVGNIVFDDNLYILDYPKAVVHLVIRESNNRIEQEESSPYWEGGILIKSGYAIHGITSCSREISNNPYFQYYFGELECSYIDDLIIEYIKREKSGEDQTIDNPCRIIDPMRDEGLSGDHPFTKALYREVGKQLLLELKKREEKTKKTFVEIENKKTTERLKKLATEVSKFIKDNTEVEEIDGDYYLDESEIPANGWLIIPRGLKLAINEVGRIYVYSKSFKNEEEKHVRISTESNAIEINSESITLLNRENGVYANFFSVKGIKIEDEIKIKIEKGELKEYVSVSVVSEKRHKEIEDFQFEKQNYVIKKDKIKEIFVVAKMPEFICGRVKIKVETSNEKVCGLENNNVILDYNKKAEEKFGRRVAIAKIRVKGLKVGGPEKIFIKIGKKEIFTNIRVAPSKEIGKNFEIKIVNEDLGSQRAVLSENLMKINGRHPIIKRYIGPEESGFKGQDSIHFHLLVAELIADTVAKKILELKAQRDVNKYKDMDVSAFYYEHRNLVNNFLETAHKIQIPDNEIKI